MRSRKLLVAVFAALSGLLYSCECEDVNLGKMELTGEVDTYLPTVNGETYKVRYDEKIATMGFSASEFAQEEIIPVRETGKTGTRGKGATYDCIEYYSAENKIYNGYTSSVGLPITVNVKLAKNVDPGTFNSIADKNKVEDVLLYEIGYYNKFPAVVTRGMSNYEGFTAIRYFTLSRNPALTAIKKNDFKQELLPSVTLNGVTYQNVYHLYLTSPQYTEDEKYMNNYYPLDYVQGIYVKEGVGIIQAYTADGKQFDITIE